MFLHCYYTEWDKRHAMHVEGYVALALCKPIIHEMMMMTMTITMTMTMLMIIIMWCAIHIYIFYQETTVLFSKVQPCFFTGLLAWFMCSTLLHLCSCSEKSSDQVSCGFWEIWTTLTFIQFRRWGSPLTPSKLRVVHLFRVSLRAGLDSWKVPNLICLCDQDLHWVF